MIPQIVPYDRSGRGFDIVIAAADASRRFKKGADHVCSGVNDEQIFNQAFTALPAIGGSIKFEGTFNISGLITTTKPVYMAGSGFNVSKLILTDGADCSVLRILGAASRFDSFKIDGNKAGQSVANPLVIVESADNMIFDVWLYSSKGDAVELKNGWNLRLYSSWFETCDGYGVYVVPESDANVATFKIWMGTFVNNKGGIYADVSAINNVANRLNWVLQGNTFSSFTERAIYLKDVSYWTLDDFTILNATDHAIELASTASGTMDYGFIGKGYANTITAGKKSLQFDTNVRRILLSGPAFPQDISSMNPDVIRKGSWWWTGTGRGTKYIDKAMNPQNTPATITAGNTSVAVTHGLAEGPSSIQITPREALGHDAYVSARNSVNFTITIPSAQGVDLNFDWYVQS